MKTPSGSFSIPSFEPKIPTISVEAVVVGLDVLVADRPVVAEAVAAAGLEVPGAEAERDAAPVVRPAAEHPAPEPHEAGCRRRRCRARPRCPSRPRSRRTRRRAGRGGPCRAGASRSSRRTSPRPCPSPTAGRPRASRPRPRPRRGPSPPSRRRPPTPRRTRPTSSTASGLAWREAIPGPPRASTGPGAAASLPRRRRSPAPRCRAPGARGRTADRARMEIGPRSLAPAKGGLPCTARV